MMNPTPDIDIGELRRLEKAAHDRANPHRGAAVEEFCIKSIAAIPALLAKWEAKDAAYHERDMVVAALSKCFPSYLARHSDDDKTWEDDWRWIVYINIPVREQVVFGDMHDVIPESQWFKTSVRQVSWHIHDSEREMFNHLEVRENNWDGHNTERKYERLAALESVPVLAAAEECERLREALIFARARIAEDSRTMNALAKIFAAQGGDLDGKLADGIEIQRKADAGTFAIIDSALTPARETGETK